MKRQQTDPAAPTELIADVMAEKFPGWLIFRDGSGRWSAVHKPASLHGGSAVELWERLSAYKRGGRSR